MTEFNEVMVDLLRHGQPEGGNRFRGSLDDPLSENGWQQMQASVGDYRQWDRVISSPLRRCQDFAATVAEQLEVPLCLHDDLRELHFGQWEGLTAAEIIARFPGQLEAFWQDPVSHCAPGGEGLREFRDRTWNAWQTLLEQHRGEHLLVICHGGVIRTILGRLLGMPLSAMLRMEVPYAGLSRVRISRFHDQEGNPQVGQNLVWLNGSLAIADQLVEGNPR
ncbi:histidine phosphatase family protein [Marinobacterium arenosum]|uniref:histidine phosphatase family protein n=1 Tax=Marinobacterium arenosum TaxID=2862496 RepID=UPI001C977147|nr:histidine phosphatase family protein [Marinobacterium arenosum]MBY4676049.1 histidine phosphatase family protein [Marinobacterium arenosum]